MLVDSFGRHIDYLRVSLTDRCNFRCTYCMDENMTFESRSEHLLSDELLLICQAFVELGVQKIRLTGGEPLIHPDFPYLLKKLSQFEQLSNIAITTNGSKVAEHIELIKQSKISQLNISLDALDADCFMRITRTGNLHQVLSGVDAAIDAGIDRVRLNAVVSKGFNDDQVLALLQYALDKSVHIAFIEQMPLGRMTSVKRSENYISNEDVRAEIGKHYQLLPMLNKKAQAGPAEYYKVAGFNSEIGFISPHSNNFCQSCNRLRLTRKGELVLCLGQDEAIDLRQIIRGSNSPLEALKKVIIDSLLSKPESHQFDARNDDVQVVRFMNVTGG